MDAEGTPAQPCQLVYTPQYDGALGIDVDVSSPDRHGVLTMDPYVPAANDYRTCCGGAVEEAAKRRAVAPYLGPYATEGNSICTCEGVSRSHDEAISASDVVVRADNNVVFAGNLVCP